MDEGDSIVVLGAEHVRELLAPADALAAVERAYRDLGEGGAVTRPRARTYLATEPPGRAFQFVSMEGGSTALGYFGLRMIAHLRQYSTVDGVPRAESVRQPGRKRFAGLVLVFDLADGMLMGMLPQESITTLRLAATSTLAARYLARPDARVLGLIGSGPQAQAHAVALAEEFELRQIRVYSPNPEHRERFAARVGEATGVEVVPVGSAREAAASDIFVTATNSLRPVYEAAWIRPGTCVVNINQHEVDPDMDARAALVVVKGKQAGLNYASPRAADNPELAADSDLDWSGYSELADLVAGRVHGRQRPDDVTFFRNNEGLGLEFAAVGARACELARERGVGHRLPREWFLV
jgi:ornithine cyclodeaminase/alanine dehydrogenase-like protein (mu-crystallin family)